MLALTTIAAAVAAMVLVLPATSSAASSWNVATDFSLTSNPNGAWSYGWSLTRGSAFNLSTGHNGVSGGTGDWAGPIPGAGGYFPLVGHVDSSYNSGCCVIPAGTVFAHPGPQGQNAVIRWTAPSSGTYSVSASWVGRDRTGNTSTAPAVLHNGTLLFSSVVLGQTPAQPYTGTVSMAAGDVLDFALGVHSYYFFGTTGVAIQIGPPAPADTTPPVIEPTVTGTLGANGWYVSDVGVTWSVTDPESAVSDTTGCGPTTITTDTRGTTLTCSATSLGGTSSKSVTIKRDATPPATTATATPAANGSGWNDTDVRVDLITKDLSSGIASLAASLDGAPVVAFACPSAVGCANAATSVVIAAEGLHTLTYQATDMAGNVEPTRTLVVRIDRMPPEGGIRFDPATRRLEVFGRDGLSGVDTVALTSTVAAPKGDGIGGEKAERRTYRIVDKAGNETTLVVDVRAAGHQIKSAIASVRYGQGPTIALDGRAGSEWSLDKDGALRELEQKAEIGGRADEDGERQGGSLAVSARFDARTNTTRIATEGPGGESKVVQPGLVIVALVTDAGALTIQR